MSARRRLLVITNDETVASMIMMMPVFFMGRSAFYFILLNKYKMYGHDKQDFLGDCNDKFRKGLTSSIGFLILMQFTIGGELYGFVQAKTQE